MKNSFYTTTNAFTQSDFDELYRLCKDYTPVATLPKADNTVWLKEFDPSNKLLVMFGTEADGLSDELINYARGSGRAVTIEMSEKVESLNLSISAGIILYKIFMN